MTNTCAHDTGRKDNAESDRPSVSSAMTGMMEGCGCGSMMAKMMAACIGAANPEDTATKDDAKVPDGEPEGTEHGRRKG